MKEQTRSSKMGDEAEKAVISYSSLKLLRVAQEKARVASGYARDGRNDASDRYSYPIMRRNDAIQMQIEKKKSRQPTNRIRLHIYDLIKDSTFVPLFCAIDLPIGQIFNALNNGMHRMGTGAYHVGVEVNGCEYAYGANDISGATGVFCHQPMMAPGFQYRTTIDLGERTAFATSKKGKDKSTYTFVDGRKVLHGMALDYMGQDYDLLRKNCCTFAIDACKRLGINEDEIPKWFRNLAEAGAVTQDAAAATIEPLAEGCGSLMSSNALIMNA